MQLNQHMFRDNERKRKSKTNKQTIVGVGYLPKRPSPYPNPKKHARQFRCRGKRRVPHSQSETQQHNGEAEGGREGGTEIGERKRGGRDGKDNSFHRKKNRLSHGREGPHLQGDTVREYPNANTERRLDSRVTDSTALVERMLFTVATGVTCSHQRHSVKHTERHRRRRRRRVSLESVHGGGPSRVTGEITNAGVFCYSSDAAQCCRPSF